MYNADDIWRQQDEVDRYVREDLELQNGRSITELVKEANKRWRVVQQQSND